MQQDKIQEIKRSQESEKAKLIGNR